ncbi:MAG: polyribonucleotide nucleotidyltransferase, partial [Nitrospirae bacterium]|nr:polyribonucleotide nucleotidyltransferase [Nitrospirota bacterium]
KVIREGKDFLPLTVDYQEKAYAAGKIPGGYFRREGRPSEREVLTSRLIDRPIRPLFPDGYYYETQVIASVLSYGEEYVSDILGIIGASAALAVSDIPFQGPVGAVRVGRLDGRFLINPSLSQNERCDLTLIVAGTAEAVMMVEGGADEVPEETLLDAIMFAHEEIRRIVACQEDLRKEIGREKRPVAPVVLDGALKEAVRTQVREQIRSAVLIPNKTARQEALAQILEETLARMSGEDAERGKQIRLAFHELERDEVRRMILEKGLRAVGRSPASIRPSTCETGVRPRTHGSALFTRGETQALVVATLGTSEDEQRIETLEGDLTKTFMLHYNFPPFSVGEARPLRSPGRREIGHGALAERAIKPVIPGKTEFPYTLRIVSDILESNGSSSMATVCGATLALMDAGVPIKAPIAGIAMGLIKEGEQVVVLSDILGLEDHLGDMDFKVTGSDMGVTALQMDIKIAGVTKEVMQTALAQAREGRLYILGKMREALAAPRSTLSAHAPRIFTLQIHKDKIRDVIGTGGKVVRGIVEQTGVKIDIEDSGLISIASPDEEAARKAIAIIQGIVQEAEVGKIYVGKVKRIMDFGAFVEIFPGTEGLVHISQISEHRVTRVSDELKEGDEVLVKVLEIDRSGKIRLSRKEAMRERATAKRG